MKRYIKSDSLDDFQAGKMDNSKKYFKMSFHIAPNGFGYTDTDAMVTAGNEYTDSAWDSTTVDIVATNVTSSGLTTVVVKNHPIAIAQLISDIRGYEEQGGYHAWFFHFTTTDERDAKPVGIWSNSLSNSEWADNDIETIDKLIQGKIKNTINSSRQIKSGWERTDMASGPIWDNDKYRIIEKNDFDSEDKFYILRDKSNQRAKDIRFDTLAEAMDYVDFRANINSSRKITSSKPWEGKKWDIYRPGVDEPYVTEDFDEMMRFKQDGFKVKLHKEEPVNSSRRPVKSARYIATDPETGEVLGSADTYEEAVNEWGEDVTITDSEVGDGMDSTQGGILSSKESNHQFNQRIVNSVLTKEITEDDAIKQIALRNNMNIGFAKRILSNLLEDKSLIQSGVMEMADDINKDFDLNGDLYSWFDDYVEDDGKSTTVGGELVRAAHRIIERFENDGDKIGIGYGKETVNPAARYILAICNDYIDRNDIEEMLYNESRINYSDEEYDAWLQQFERTFEDYLRNHEELFHAPNKNDMWDYKEEDDVSSSVSECCIYDDEGNEYWFQKDDNGWKCTNIEYTSQSKYKINDYVDDLADIPDTSGDFCDFELDGFEYSAERASNGEDWIITNVSIDNGLADVNDIWETEDFEGYGIFDANGREINVSDLY